MIWCRWLSVVFGQILFRVLGCILMAQKNTQLNVRTGMEKDDNG